MPGANDRVLPGDDLLVIGTDEQLVGLNRALAEAPAEPVSGGDDDVQVELLKFGIGARSPLVGIGIRASRLKELARGLVVGIERGEERLLNPDGAVTFAAGDVVWVAGDGAKLRELMQGKGDLV